MRFLFKWQHVESSCRLTGVDGLRAVIAQLDGVDLPARAWERDVLAPRLERYDPAWLDTLCLSGEVGWARLSPAPTQVVGATPIALFLREHADAWLALRPAPAEPPDNTVLDRLRNRGASFAHDLASACRMTADDVHSALAELVAAGLISSDGSAGLRRFTGRGSPGGRARRPGADGRWFLLEPSQPVSHDAAVETFAWTLLRRYGVVFRRLVHKDPAAPPWRELGAMYRKLEARGLIRGGRFVGGMAGEQFAMIEAVEQLRGIRRSCADGQLITICAVDPLNLTGIVTPGDRVRATPGNRVVYRDGVPVAALEGDMLCSLASLEPAVAVEAAAAAAGRPVPVTSGYVGRLS
jgi:ATP-dependent Lhr-like helicase